MEMHFMIGAMASGKSTVIATLANPYIHSLDTIRVDTWRAAGNSHDDPKTEYRIAWEWCNTHGKPKFAAAITASLQKISTNKYPVVVIDEMNLTPKSRAQMLDFARKNGYATVAHEFIVSLDTLKARQYTRTDKFIPLDAVEQAYYRLVPPMIGTEFDRGVVHITEG